MNIDYNIIWVDDKIDTKPFKGVIKKIEKFLSEQFFNVTIVTAEDFEEFKDKYNQNIDYDLIITDLNLNNSKGNDVINFIRLEKIILTEVFFYSANSEVSNTGLANSSRITFFRLDDHNSYNSLQNKLEEVISLTIAKFQHIVSMRGMIMHETSSLDAQMFEMVDNYIRSNDDNVRITLFEELVSYFERKYKLSSKCKDNNNVNNILKDPLLLSSSQRANVLSSIIKTKGYENFISDFKTEIINVRNQFAHAVLEKDNNGNDVFKNKKENIVFNAEYSKEIRKNIIKHKKNLDTLEKELSR
jgi:CheY-like chemotaxis protein